MLCGCIEFDHEWCKYSKNLNINTVFSFFRGALGPPNQYTASPLSMGYASLSGGFMESFMTLNIINFADVARREKIGISWDVGRVSSP